MNPRRIYLAVALCAIVVYVGSLWNGFALDDGAIVLNNPLMQSVRGLWNAFARPYWPPELGGKMYRPLPVATFVLDARVMAPAWFHAVNLLWHAAASVAVAALTRRLSNDWGGLAAGVLFAVHPVHVEAVANVVGRAELMAALFTVLAVYAAIVARRPVWSAIALAAGLLCKENAAVAPALIAWAWLLKLQKPTRREVLTAVTGWIVVATAYGLLRSAVLHPYTRYDAFAPVFTGLSPVAVRLTGVAALRDVGRLLLWPAHLRVEYTPLERTAVLTVSDTGFLIGATMVVLWAALLYLAWRSDRKVEAFGLGWIAVAYAPVANLVFPSGVLVAERTLYLPSVGLLLTVGALLAQLETRRLALVVGALAVLGGVRSALRVPVWRDDRSVTLSILEDSPSSYRGPARAGAMFQTARQPQRALEAYRVSIRTYPLDAAVYVAAADAAFTLGQPALADTMLGLANQVCFRCSGALRVEARAARARGDRAAADSLDARAMLLDTR